jgi:hypothetical protein
MSCLLEMCSGLSGKRHPLHFGLKAKGDPKPIDLHSGDLPAFYRRTHGGKNHRQLANPYLQQ